ncbi:hypothetical protein Aperf_G00000057618 [Anoplocephala perfoliata]
MRAGSTAWYPTSPRGAPIIRPRSDSGSRPPHICALRSFRGQGLRGLGPGFVRMRSTTSSLESSDAPPWQLTSPPLSSTSRSLVPIRRKIYRSGEAGAGVAESGIGSAESTVGAMRKRRHLAAMPQNVDTAGHQRELDVKWKRKSFKRSNGYDAADVIDRTPSTYLEPQPHRHEPRLTQPSTMRTTTTIVHESRGVHEEDGESRGPGPEDTSIVVTTPPMTSSVTTTATDSRDLEAGIRKLATPRDHLDGRRESVFERRSTEGDEDDIDKVVASVSHPRNAPDGGTPSGYGSGSLTRVPKTIGQGILVGKTTVDGNELAILGFANRIDYWEHPAFGRSRITGIVLAFSAICCLLYCLVASTWVYSGIPGNMIRRGLWRKCSIINSSCEITIPFLSESDGWQGAATCLLLVSILIGLLGTGLAIFGHSGSDLVKRLYYFHSSGEIFFLAGFSTFLTFGVYRSYASLNLLNPRQPNAQTASTRDPHFSLTTNTTAISTPVVANSVLKPRWQIYYGAADIVGWCGGVIFMASAAALLLDEFLHELTRMGHTRWPNLARFLHWSAVHVTASNRRMRNAQRRCLRTLHKRTTSASSTTVPATTVIIDPTEAVSYRPTTGASIRQHRRWRLQRQ